MTLMQYASKFIELSRFVPYLIPTKPLKADKCEQRLMIRNFSDLEDRVVILKENLHVILEEFNQKKRQFQPSNQR